MMIQYQHKEIQIEESPREDLKQNLKRNLMKSIKVPGKSSLIGSQGSKKSSRASSFVEPEIKGHNSKGSMATEVTARAF